MVSSFRQGAGKRALAIESGPFNNPPFSEHDAHLGTPASRKKCMSGEEFLRGYPITSDMHFGSEVLS